MRTEGTFTVPSPPTKVFDFLSDAHRIMDCLDDPHTVEVQDPSHFSGTITTGVAFIRGTFRLTGEFTELGRPSRVVARLHGSGMGSGLDASVVIELSDSGGTTTVRWTADLTLSGPVASVGERLVRSTLDKKTQALFARARDLLAPGG